MGFGLCATSFTDAMKFFSRSFTSRLVFYFSALSFFTVSMVGAIALIESEKTLKRSIFGQLETTANLQQQTLETWFQNQGDRYESWSENLELRQLTATLLDRTVDQGKLTAVRRDLDTLLQPKQAASQGVIEIAIVNPSDGTVVYSTKGQDATGNAAGSDFFDQGKGSPVWRYPLPGDEHFIFRHPIQGRDQAAIGVLVVRFAGEELARTILQFHGRDRGERSYLVTGADALLMDDGSLLSIPAVQQRLLQRVLGGEPVGAIYQNFAGTVVLGVYRWLPEQKLALFVEMERQQALQPLRQLVWKVIFFGGIVIVLAIAGSYGIARLMTKPILAIKETALKVTQGNLKIQAPVFTEDEVGTLAQAFNQMIDEFGFLYEDFNNQVTQLEMAEISAQQSFYDLQDEKRKVDQVMTKLEQANEEISRLNERLKTENLDLAAEIQATNERLNQFLEAIPVGILVLEGSGNLVYINRKAQILLGEEAAMQNVKAYPLYLADDHSPCPPEKVLGQRALLHRVSSTYDDLEIHHDGQIIPVESWETPILDEQETVKYAIVAFQDITERRQAEQEKQNYTRKLWQLNQANERFVPRQFLQLLDKHSIVDVQLGDNVQKEMTVLFADIRGFTRISEGMTPEDNFKFINAFLSRMNPAISNHFGFIDKYIGDAIMALFSRVVHADDAIQGAIAMLKILENYNQTRQRPDRPPIRIGLGLNSGLMRCGTVGGDQHMESTVISDAVNLASRLERLTKTYRTNLLISHHTFLRLENHENYHIRLIDHVTVSGKSIAVSVYEVFDADPPEMVLGKQESKSNFEQALVLYRLGQFIKAQKLFTVCLERSPQDYVSQLYIDRCQQHMVSSTSNLINENYFDSGKLQ